MEPAAAPKQIEVEASVAAAGESPEISSSEKTPPNPKDYAEPAAAPTDEVLEKSPKERYLRFNEVLGRGSYKEVWRSYDTVEGIEVAWNARDGAFRGSTGIASVVKRAIVRSSADDDDDRNTRAIERRERRSFA